MNSLVLKVYLKDQIMLHTSFSPPQHWTATQEEQ